MKLPSELAPLVDDPMLCYVIWCEVMPLSVASQPYPLSGHPADRRSIHASSPPCPRAACILCSPPVRGRPTSRSPYRTRGVLMVAIRVCVPYRIHPSIHPLLLSLPPVHTILCFCRCATRFFFIIYIFLRTPETCSVFVKRRRIQRLCQLGDEWGDCRRDPVLLSQA